MELDVLQRLACALLLIVALLAVFAGQIAPAHYATQFRDVPNAPPSRQHLLGTDDVGRDRFSRLLYGTRISLLLAPAAAFLSTVLAAGIGGVAGYLGGAWARCAMSLVDLFLSLPWLFLLITVRGLLPLDVSPFASVLTTFLLLGLLGWAFSARILCASAAAVRDSGFLLQARASGLPGLRLFAVHVLPNLKPILLAQFWISIPVFVLAEANLGVLGLGVAEPMPSWGSLLRELEGMLSLGEAPWKLVPLILLVLVVSSFELTLNRQEYAA
jgi:ABC-type dipeptide/oligopeptide/nickel transport system permease subunit